MTTNKLRLKTGDRIFLRGEDGAETCLGEMTGYGIGHPLCEVRSDGPWKRFEQVTSVLSGTIEFTMRMKPDEAKDEKPNHVDWQAAFNEWREGRECPRCALGTLEPPEEHIVRMAFRWAWENKVR